MVLGHLARELLVDEILRAEPGRAPVTVPYTLFKQEVGKGNVEAIHSQGETITGRFKAPVTYPPAGEKVRHPTASQKRQVKKCGAYWRRVPNSERGRCGSPRRTQSGQ